MRTANIHIIDAAVRDIWVDVKVFAVLQGEWQQLLPSAKQKTTRGELVVMALSLKALTSLNKEVRPFSPKRQWHLEFSLFLFP